MSAARAARIRFLAWRVSVSEMRWHTIHIVALLAGSGSSFAAPRVPTDDGEVLERLPDGVRQARALERMHAAFAGRPARAARLAQAYVELARATGDPRYAGRAQGALAPWWDLESPPPDVLLLRAVLRQGHHQFAAALRDLDRLIALRPGDG